MNEKTGSENASALRMTRQRRVILEELKKVSSHPTAEMVYRMARRRLANISLGTVYRNLEILSRHGLISTLKSAGLPRRYDGNPERHYHIRCVRCGRVDDFPTGALAALSKSAQEACGYEILGYRLEFAGLCPKCRKLTKQKK